MLRIGVLISGGGTNLQTIIDACALNTLASEVVLIISNKPQAYGLERGKKAGIPSFGISKKAFKDKKMYFKEMQDLLKEHEVDLVVLAGFLEILPKSFIQAFEHRIINIHPSLIPKYAGKGYYGIKVHEGVINNQEAYTGATVHFVDDQVDTGQIILQEAIKVFRDDTPVSLQERVLQVEHSLLIKSIQKYIRKEI
jgi:phosphoribosylglycinamide formyltransferase-1